MVVEEAIGDATLHDETLAELGLSDQPFVDNKKFNRFSDSSTQKVRAAMEQHLRFGDSIHLLIGEKGVGKTVFLSQLIKHCKTSIQPFVAKGTDNFETVAFLAAVLNQLGGDETESISDHVDALIPLFDDFAEDQKSVVLAIDDAHLAPLEEIAELIDVMASFNRENGDLTARLLLTGEPRLKDELTAIADELEDSDFSFEQGTTTLYPLEQARIGDYLTSHLNQAGFTDAFPFTDKSIGKIHRESRGLPGDINTHAAKYLNTVYSGKAGVVGGKGVLAALGWPLLALGAAAVGLIAWGLSMFFGGSAPDNAVVTIDSPDVVESATVAVQDTQLPNTENISTDLLRPESGTTETIASVQPATPAINANAEADTLLKPEDQLTAAISSTVENSELQTDTLVVPEADAVADTVADSTSTAVETVIEVSEPVMETAQDTAGSATDALPSAGQAETVVENIVSDTPTVNVTQPADPVSIDVTEADTTAATASSAERNTDALLATDLEDSSGIAVAIDQLNTTGAAATVQTVVQPNTSPATDTNNGVAIDVAAPVVDRAIENERWVLFQTPTKFTVQLATSRERGYIIDLAQTLAAEDPVAIYPFRTTNSNNPVFGLLSGLYDTRSDAIAAVDRMATETKQFGVWIRPIADLQAAIKNQQ